MVHKLRQLPRSSELVFPLGIDELRKAWKRICREAGFTGDSELRIHDLRHEAISRVAEAGSNTPGGFSLVDLQHFSGHRDVRMLLRYAHLCTQSLAKRLDAAFGDDTQTTLHHGMRRLRKGATITLQEVISEPPALDAATSCLADCPVPPAHTGVASIAGNVIRVNFGRNNA
jgi:integrase